ncbi:MAG: hypothetical protein JEZ11_03580 [Desulfobacterales bacterium]|nr:hypothetical protein [Desulfobacterales bacterium]
MLKTIVQWLLNLSIGLYLALFCTLVFRKGIGFEFTLWGIHISANDAGKTFLILFALIIARSCLRIDRKNLLLLCMSLIFSGFLAEVGLRMVAPPLASSPSLQQMMRPSRHLGYELIPGIAGKGRLGNGMEINSHGLRDVERTWNKPPGAYRILGLGDSYTFGVGLDLEQTFVKQIQTRLRPLLPGVDVINGGVAGYNLFQALSYFKEKGRNYVPDFVTYFFFLDDAKGLESEAEAERRYAAAVSSASENEEDAFQQVASKSYLYNFTTNLLTLIGGKFRSFNKASWLRSIEHRKKYFLASNNDSINGSLDMRPFTNQLAELKRLCGEMGIPLLLVVIPDSVQVADPLMQGINGIVKKICIDVDIPFLDITPRFEKEKDLNSLYLFPLDAHTSAKGNAVIAEAVVEKIAEMALLEVTKVN